MTSQKIEQTYDYYLQLFTSNTKFIIVAPKRNISRHSCLGGAGIHKVDTASKKITS